MTTTTRTIPLSEIGPEAVGNCGECSALEPGAADPVIVELYSDGSLGCIVDGFHRTSGMVSWAREQGLALEDVQVTVVVSDDEDLVAAAAEPGEEQDDAIAALYAAAGIE